MLISQIVVVILFIMLLLYALFWLLGIRHNRRRGQLFLAALNDSTGAKVTVCSGPDAHGFIAFFEPSPAPFYYIAAIFRPAPPVTYWLRPLWQSRDRLLIRAILTEMPHNGLFWTHGEIPGLAAGYQTGTDLWRRRVLDTANSEFGVRGPNCGALENAFRAAFMRFGPLLERYHLMGDAAIDRRLRNIQLLDPQGAPVDFEVVVSAAKLATEELSALVAQMRAAGRAALLK